MLTIINSLSYIFLFNIAEYNMAKRVKAGEAYFV